MVWGKNRPLPRPGNVHLVTMDALVQPFHPGGPPFGADSGWKGQNIIKDPHWYVVQGSDTTMTPRSTPVRTKRLHCIITFLFFIINYLLPCRVTMGLPDFRIFGGWIIIFY